MSAARLMVLGVIHHRGKAHGYQIMQEIASWCPEEWATIKAGSIYHALNQLEREGIIRAFDAADRSQPKHTQFGLTDIGKTEYIQLTETALLSDDLDTLAAGIAFMHDLSRQRTVELLEQNLAKQTALQAYVHGVPTSPIPKDPSEHPEIIGLWTDYIDSCVSRLSGILTRVKAGWYRFKDDE